MAYHLGKLRRSSVLMTHGPGSVVDFRARNAAISAVISGLDSWDWDFRPEGLKNEQVIFEDRLQKKLGVGGFRLPPVVADNFFFSGDRKSEKALSAVRFPNWLQCTDCKRIGTADKWMDDAGEAALYCPYCSKNKPGNQKSYVVPVRFVMACEAGHLDDFPWEWWVQHKEGCKNKKSRGFLKLESKGPGLGGIFVSCPDCDAPPRSLDGIFSENALAGYSCTGRRPWLYGPNEKCDLQPRVLQRGASNLYFPVIESALSIPPWSDEIREEIGVYWNEIINADDEDRLAFVRMLAKGGLKKTFESLSMSPEELVKIIDLIKKRYEKVVPEKIREEEYIQFTLGKNTRPGERGEFEIRGESVPEILTPYFSCIIRAVRLREVRALRGFTRIKPPGGEDDINISPLSNTKKDWLPAIEVRGEGIFIEFNKETLREWEKDLSVSEKAEDLNIKMAVECNKKYGDSNPPKKITPRFLLIHTFAHALMRQLTLECGYSTASLRERLYISEDGKESDGMAGFLIYTASPDSDGTLGGLQRQGESKRIGYTIISAVKSMEWCSSDPLCITGMMAIPESFSIASCHGCCMAPETSCEEFNRFLDRGMLIGHHDNPNSGYFNKILRE